MLPTAVLFGLLACTRSFASVHIENDLEDTTVEIRPEEVLEHSSKRRSAEEVLRTAGVLDYLLELLEDEDVGADVDDDSDTSGGEKEERDAGANYATVSGGDIYERLKQSRVHRRGDAGYSVPVTESEDDTGQPQALPEDIAEPSEADPAPAVQNAARNWQSLDDTVLTEATNLVFEALYKRKPRRALDADPPPLPPPPAGLCVRSCGVPSLAGWYELNGTFGGAPAFSRERPGTMGHTVQIIRYGHKSGAKYWYMSDLKNRGVIDDDEDFWRTSEPSHSSLPPVGTPEAWTTLSTTVWSGSELSFSAESDRARCEAATFETPSVALWAAAIPMLEALLEHDHLLAPLVILIMVATVNFVRLARLPALGQWLFALGARVGLTGWRGTVIGLAALLLAQHVHRLDWATNVSIAVDALISIWALPLWLNLGRLAVIGAFCGLRWLLLGPLTAEEEAGQWALFYEEGSGMLTLIGSVGLWLPDDSLLAVTTILFLGAVAFLSLVASIAVNRMQQMLAGRAATNTAVGAARANEDGSSRMYRRFFAGVGHPSQMMAHCRLLGSLLLGQATVVGLMLVMMSVAAPEGLTVFQSVIWRFKILLLFTRASKKSVRGLVHYAILIYGNVHRSHLWNVMVAKTMSLATDAAECAGVGLLFGVNLCSGSLSVSISDFVYAMVKFHFLQVLLLSLYFWCNHSIFVASSPGYICRSHLTCDLSLLRVCVWTVGPFAHRSSGAQGQEARRVDPGVSGPRGDLPQRHLRGDRKHQRRVRHLPRRPLPERGGLVRYRSGAAGVPASFPPRLFSELLRVCD